MSASVVPPPLPPSTAPPPPTTAVIATVPKPPAALAALQLQSLFSAKVIDPVPGKGMFEVETDFGKFRLQTLLQLKPGAKLGLQIQALAPKLTLLITSLNDKPLQQGAAAWNRTAETLGARGNTDTIQTLQTNTLPNKGAPILATVMRGTPLAGQKTGAQAGQTAAQQGQMLNQNPGTGAAGARGTPMTPGGGQPAGAPQSAGSTTNLSGQQIQTAFQNLMSGKGKPLPTGMQLLVRVTNVTQSAAATQTTTNSQNVQQGATNTGAQQAARAAPVSTQAPTPQAPLLLTGQVTGSTPQGQTLVQTANGLLALETKTAIAAGSRVHLEINPQQVLQKPTAPTIATASGGTVHMPGLGEALEVIQEHNPALARQVISSAVPRPDAALGNTLIFFLTALRVGTLRNLIGDSAFRVIDTKGKAGLAGRLGDEFTNSIKTVSDPVTGDWRIAHVPLMHNGQLGDIRVSFRDQHNENDKEGEDDKEGTRFVIDLALEKFGRIQLDGLAKEKKKHFDLIIRTAKAMPADIRKDINGIFTSSCDAHGLVSQLAFQLTPKFVELGGVEMDNKSLGLVV